MSMIVSVISPTTDPLSKRFKFLTKNDPNVNEKYGTLILNAKESRLTLLNQTIEFLSQIKDDGIRETGLINFIQSVLSLIVSPAHVPDDLVLELTNFMITQAKHFDSGPITQVINYCLEYIKEHPDLNLPVRWIDIFGKLISVVAGRGEIETIEGDIMEGQEYKGSIINEICRLKWCQNNAASLIAVLREIPGIDSTEINEILRTCGKYMKKFDPSAIPPIAYQLLLLTGTSHPDLVIKHFDDYFLEVSTGDESSTSDPETSRLEQGRRVKALGTTIFHFVQAARHNERFLQEILRRVKKSQLNYQTLMTPFMISLALGLTSIGTVKTMIVESLRIAIIRQFMEIQLSSSFLWFYKCSGQIFDSITECFKSLFSSSPAEMDFMLEGLKDLGLGLLNHEYGKDINSRDNCIPLGIYLLKSIVSRNPELLPKLMNEFLKSQTNKACIECLAKCITEVRMSLINKRFSGRIVELIHHLPLMTVESAVPILKSLLPVLQLSYDLFEEVMMVMRKTIWKSVEARKVSVSAMVLLLTNSQLVGSIPKNLYSQSQTFTQITTVESGVLGSAGKNEQLCVEVLQMMKRFFSQQIEVREHLYLGVQTIVRRNPELVTTICKNVVLHVKHYMTPNADSPDLANIVECDSDNRIVTLENVGLLIQCLCHVVLKAEQVYSDEEVEEPLPPIVSKSRLIIEVWKSTILGIGTGDFEDHTAGMLQNRTVPLEIARELRDTLIIQTMQVIEVIIEFLCLDENSMGGSAQQKELKDSLQKFNEFSKDIKPTKPKKVKKESKKKGTSSKGSMAAPSPNASSSSGTNSTTSSTSVSAKLKVKLPGSVKKIVQYSHIIQLNSVKIIFEKLYEIQNRKSPLLSSLNDKMEFELFLLSALKQKLNYLKQKSPLLKERDQNPIERNKMLLSIGKSLWWKCMRPRDSSTGNTQSQNGDDEEAKKNPEQLRLQCLVEIFEYLTQENPKHVTDYFGYFCGGVGTGDFSDQFKDFFTQWAQWMDNYEITEESKDSHTPTRLCSIFKLLLLTSHGVSVESVELLPLVKDWLQAFSQKCPWPEAPKLELEVMESFLKVYIAICSKISSVSSENLMSLAKHAHYLLTDLSDETEKFKPAPQEKSWMINIYTAPVLLNQFGIYIENTLELIKKVVSKLNCHTEAKYKEKNRKWREMCYKVMQSLLNLLTHLVRSHFPSGPCVDVLQRTIVTFFNTMASLTENLYHDLIKTKNSSPPKSFENLVKLVGADFKENCDTMVKHIGKLRDDYLQQSKSKKLKQKQDPKVNVPVSLKHKFTKDAKTMPILVYSVEKYEQHLFVLSKNLKAPQLLYGTKASNSRDFRVSPSKLKQAVRQGAGGRSLTPPRSASDDDSRGLDNDDTTISTPLAQPPNFVSTVDTSDSSSANRSRINVESSDESDVDQSISVSCSRALASILSANEDEESESNHHISTKRKLSPRSRPGPASAKAKRSRSRVIDSDVEVEEDETVPPQLSFRPSSKPKAGVNRRLNLLPDSEDEQEETRFPVTPHDTDTNSGTSSPQPQPSPNDSDIMLVEESESSPPVPAIDDENDEMNMPMDTAEDIGDPYALVDDDDGSGGSPIQLSTATSSLFSFSTTTSHVPDPDSQAPKKKKSLGIRRKRN